MLIASAFKRPVMWSSAGFVQVGRSNQLFLLLINITWPAVISLLSSFPSSPLLLRSVFIFSSALFFFILFNISHRAIPEVKIFSISSLLMVRPQSYRRQIVRSSSREPDKGEIHVTKDGHLFYRNENPPFDVEKVSWTITQDKCSN